MPSNLQSEARLCSPSRRRSAPAGRRCCTSRWPTPASAFRPTSLPRSSRLSSRPTAAACGRAALDELRRAADAGQAFPLVLLDATLPDVNGLDLAEQIQATPDLAPAGIVFLSSAERQDEVRRCRSAGLAQLAKPV